MLAMLAPKVAGSGAPTSSGVKAPTAGKASPMGDGDGDEPQRDDDVLVAQDIMAALKERDASRFADALRAFITMA